MSILQDKARKWRFGFDEYYDVYVWDASAGRSFFILQRKLEEVSSCVSCRHMKTGMNVYRFLHELCASEV